MKFFKHSIRIIIIAVFFFIPIFTIAKELPGQVKFFDVSNKEEIKNVLPFGSNYSEGVSFATCDFDNDYTEEIVLGVGVNNTPLVKIIDTSGLNKFTNGFMAYNSNFLGGVNVVCGDLNNDGEPEIITVPKTSGPAHIRIFNKFGESVINPGFFAFPKEIKNGFNLAIGDLDGGGINEIFVSAAFGNEPLVNVFNSDGEKINLHIYPFHPDFKGGISMAVANLDGELGDELAVAVQNLDSARIKILKFDKSNNSSKIYSEFTGFPENYKGGVNLATIDLNQDGIYELAVSANAYAPHVRLFNSNGKNLNLDFFTNSKSSNMGSVVDSIVLEDGSQNLLSALVPKNAEAEYEYPEYIEVDISDQQLYYFQNGKKILEYTVSTGKSSMPTPLGEFKIMNMAREAYSKKYSLYMPYWMQITSAGHGLHGLPFWKLKNGGIIYEGEDHLGKQVSHGCVRLPVSGAAKLFSYVKPGTMVIIHM